MHMPSEKREVRQSRGRVRAWRLSRTWSSSSPDPAVYGGRACAGGNPVCPPGFATRGVHAGRLAGFGLIGTCPAARLAPVHPSGAAGAPLPAGRSGPTPITLEW